MGSLPQSADVGKKDSFHGMTYTLVVINLLWRSFHFALMLEGVQCKKIPKWRVLDKFLQLGEMYLFCTLLFQKGHLSLLKCHCLMS